MKPRPSISSRWDYHQVYFNAFSILWSPNAFFFILPPSLSVLRACLYVVCACVSTCLYTWTCVCICSWRQEVNIKCLSLLFSTLEPLIFQSSSPEHWLQVYTTAPGFLWCWESNPSIACFVVSTPPTENYMPSPNLLHHKESSVQTA